MHRLDSYEKFHSELFDRVVRLVKSKFIPIVEKHSISGLAYINSEDSVFDDPLAIAILIDVFTERGFTAVVDIRRMEVPSRIDPKSYEIINRVKKVYRVRINFLAQKIRTWLILFYNFMDPRYKALANNLVTHSTNIQPGEKVLLHSFDIPERMTLALIRAVRERNAIPFVQVQSALLDRECILDGSTEQFESSSHWEMERMQKMDAYIAIEAQAMYLRILIFLQKT